MATAYSRLADAPMMRAIAADPSQERNRQTIQGMVDGFATQDIDSIMSLIAGDAIFFDILGKGTNGDEYRGKEAIRKAFVRQFDIAGEHSYCHAKIMVEGDLAFASWTLVIGDPADPKAARFDGIDEFSFNSEGQIILKKAWLKGQPRLRRILLARNPAAVFRHLRYSISSWGR